MKNTDSKKVRLASIHRFEDLIGGGLGGLACVAAGQPFDTVKVKLQTFPHLYKSIPDCIRKTYVCNRGIRGFYAGSTPAFITNLIENAVLFLVYEHCLSLIRWSNSYSSNDVSLIHHSFAGALSSVAATVTYAPVDRVKSLMQVEKELQKGVVSRNRKSQLRILKDIVHSEGIRGLYRGLTSLLARETPGYFFFFTGYAGSKKLLMSSDETIDDLAIWKVMLSGGIAGCCFWGSMYPIDVIKARIQVRKELSGSFFKNAMLVLQREVKTGNIWSIYRGLTPTMVRSFFANGALFLTYEGTKRYCQNVYIVDYSQ